MKGDSSSRLANTTRTASIPQPHQLRGPARPAARAAARRAADTAATRCWAGGVRPGAARCQSAHQERHFWCRGCRAAGARLHAAAQLTPATRPRWRYRHLGALRGGGARQQDALLLLSPLHCHHYTTLPLVIFRSAQSAGARPPATLCRIMTPGDVKCRAIICLAVSVSLSRLALSPCHHLWRLCQRGDRLGIIISLIMSGRWLWSELDKWCHCNYAATGPGTVWSSRNLSCQV